MTTGSATLHIHCAELLVPDSAILPLATQVKTPSDEFSTQLLQLTPADGSWIADGNYKSHRSFWFRATDIICTQHPAQRCNRPS